ncbi:hypothetical protein [Brucella intermedia]|uniref:hypothetical protein n=1 Tax=Brucella intermedia TaxID=94625 RepID=UPI00224A4927|nr:hypothetical protein [Brucella intermedia]
MTQSLITRLSKLDAPDREVDAAVFRYLAGNPTDHWFSFGEDLYTDETVPHITGSTDAVIALAKRVFGKVGYSVAETEDDEEAPFAFIHVNGEAYLGEGATPAIALCIALLRAKEASKL